MILIISKIQIARLVIIFKIDHFNLIPMARNRDKTDIKKLSGRFFYTAGYSLDIFTGVFGCDESRAHDKKF